MGGHWLSGGPKVVKGPQFVGAPGCLGHQVVGGLRFLWGKSVWGPRLFGARGNHPFFSLMVRLPLAL